MRRSLGQYANDTANLIRSRGTLPIHEAKYCGNVEPRCLGHERVRVVEQFGLQSLHYQVSSWRFDSRRLSHESKCGDHCQTVNRSLTKWQTPLGLTVARDPYHAKPTQNMTVTELLNHSTTSTIPVVPDRVGSFEFPTGIGTGDPFLDGVQLHSGLRLLSINRPHLSPRYQRLWPVLTSIRSAVITLGADRISPEVNVTRGGLVGRVDLRASGTSGVGHIEIKVVARLPDAPRQRDLHQTALYLSLSHQRSPAWAAIIYVSLNDGEARYFVFKDAIPLLLDGVNQVSRN